MRCGVAERKHCRIGHSMGALQRSIMQHEQNWVALAEILGPRSPLLKPLVKAFGTPEAIFAAEEEIGSPEERLDRIIEIRYKNQLTDEKNSKKVINSLFRLGYGYDMIKDAIYKVKEEIADELYGNE
jgi:hypothetical protein